MLMLCARFSGTGTKIGMWKCYGGSFQAEKILLSSTSEWDPHFSLETGTQSNKQHLFLRLFVVFHLRNTSGLCLEIRIYYALPANNKRCAQIDTIL